MQTPAPRLDRDFPADDAEVIRRVCAGESELFQVLMRRHNEMVYRAARARLSSEAEVEEVMQKAYLLAFSKLAQFEGRSKFSTWMVRITLNVASTHAGKIRAVPTMTEAEPVTDGPEDQVATNQLVEFVQNEADQLSESLRTVFLLRDVEGMSAAETAECLGLTDEAVRVRLHRARKQIRDGLLDRVGALGPSLFRFYAPRCNRVVDRVMNSITAMEK